LTILISCQNNEQLKLVQQTDLKGIYEIGIPEDWHIEKQVFENSSFLIASDTTKTVEQTLVVDLTWNDWEIYLNEHLKRSLDSISNLSGFKTSNQKFYSRAEFDIYEYELVGTDSLNNLGVKAKNYYFKKDGKKGSLNLNIRVNKRDFNQKDSILIEKIIKTIKRK
jgi:hypothetical protein